MRVILAKTYGFCFGVKRALGIAKKQKKAFVLREVVHNPQVVAGLKSQGIKSVKSLKAVLRGETIIFSAHGVAPQVFGQAQRKNLKIIDATCPLVLKVHQLVKMLVQKGYQILYLGDPHHEEVKGVLAQAPKKIQVLPNVPEVKNLKIKNSPKLAVLTQTTLSTAETEEMINYLKKKFPQILVYNTICQATEERQKAVGDLAKKVEALVVVGGKKSANTKRLWETAQNLGRLSYWIEEAKDLKRQWFVGAKTVGVTAGASTPDRITQSVVKKLKNWSIPKV